MASSKEAKMTTEEELVISIREKMTDFQITVSDLKAPTAKFVQSYFIRFLEELDVNVANFQMTANQMAKMTCPNSILHIVPLLQLFGALGEIAKHIFIKDFSLSDLTRPNPKRTLMILNNFDGFHTYADMLAGRYQEMRKGLLDRKQKYKELLAQVNGMQEEVRRQSKMPDLNKALKQEIGEVKKKLMQKQQEMSEIEKKIVEAESVVKKLEMKCQKVTSEHDEMNDQVMKLQTQMVYSPEVNQLNLKLHKLEKMKSEGEKKLQELQDSAQKKVAQINLFKKSISDQEQSLQEMQTLVQLVTQNRMLDEENQALEKREVAAKAKQADLKEKLVKNRSKLKQLSEQKKLKTEMEKELAEIKKKVEETEREVAEKAKNSVEFKKKISEMEQEIAKKVESSNKKSDLYDELYEKKINELNGQLDTIIHKAFEE